MARVSPAMGRAQGPSTRGLLGPPSQAPAVARWPTQAPCPLMAGARGLCHPTSLPTGPEVLAVQQQCTEIKTPRLSTIRTSLPSRAISRAVRGLTAVKGARGVSLGGRGQVQCSPTTTTTHPPSPPASTPMVWAPPQSVCPRLL